MLTFYNEKGEGFGAQVEFTVKNAVNGERSISGTIISNDRVLSEIDRGWKFELNGEFFTIIYAKPRDEGRNLSVSFDAVHQFFYDFDHSNCYTEFNGSHRFEVYIEAIFKDSGYRYQIEPNVRVNSIRKENFGNAKRLEMFKDIVKAAGLEFSVSGKVVLITKKIGADLSTVVRKNFNMNELVIEKNINKFITYKRGLGAWKDEEDHSKGRYTSEYESPLASIYGRIEGEPVTDERYKDTGKLLERLKFEVDNSYSISVQLDMEDLTRAGYQYTQPRAGDYIMAINETIGFREKIRIVSFESSYDVTGRLINHKVTCNDIGSVQKQISSEGSIIRSVGQSKEFAESALAVATKALVSADGKNTVYYGATKPKDEPIGTIRRGDILYLTAGEDTEMYIWNGSEWELKKLKLDTAELEKEFDKVKKATEQASEENKRRTEEALKKAGTSEDLAKEAKKIADESVKNLNTFKSTAERAQTALSGNLDALKRTVTNEVNQASEHRRTTTEALSRMTGQMNGFATKSEVRQNVDGLTETFAKLKTDTNNLISGAKSDITLAKTEFQKTADGLSVKMSAVESYVDQDGQRQEALRRYTREESARQATAVRDLVTRDYVGKSTYQEDVRGLERRFREINTQTNNDIATKIAQYKQTVDGQFASITSQMAGKVNQTDFQRVKETSQLYERILGNTEQGLPDKISRLVMTNEIFQTEVGKYVTDDNNLIVNSMTMNKHTLVNANRNGVNVSVNEGVFTVKAQGLTSYNFSGFTLPIYVKKIYRGETYTLGFKYRIRSKLDSVFAFNVKNHKLNKLLLNADIGTSSSQTSNEWQEFQKTFTVQEDFAFGEDTNYPFYIYLAKNGWIEFKEPILVRGSKTGPYKPSQFDDAYKQTKEAKELAESAQTQAIRVAEKAEETKRTLEATRTQMTLLSNSWSVRTLNGPGDVLGAINLNPDGSVKINEGLISIGEKTYIKDGVIKKSMIGNAQIGTAHIGEIDASQARLINVSAKNIVSEGLTANIIRGGKLSSLNGDTDFDLQTGWIEMNSEGVGIRNQFAGRPLQYLVFAPGRINGKLGSYTALMSNSKGKISMDDGSAGIQIWNTNDNTSAINLYGDEIAMLYNANDPKGIIFDNIKNEIRNIETMWIKGKSLEIILNDIFWNFRVLSDGGAKLPYNYFKYWNGDK
nr:MAG TPA: tail protein [Caudoviricetes sp.]